MDNENKMTGIILYIAHAVLFFFLGRKYGKELIDGLKGDNGKWEAPEVIIAVCILLLIIVALANLFLNFDVTAQLWGSIDFILLVSLGVHGAIKHKKTKP
jgi:hypothetical protein